MRTRTEIVPLCHWPDKFWPPRPLVPEVAVVIRETLFQSCVSTVRSQTTEYSPQLHAFTASVTQPKQVHFRSRSRTRGAGSPEMSRSSYKFKHTKGLASTWPEFVGFLVPWTNDASYEWLEVGGSPDEAMSGSQLERQQHRQRPAPGPVPPRRALSPPKKYL
ncbi:hypothetical protein J6590_031663 [Homalodisca vitripennis]|nr:hypothetical protein J6590_031663 [Homalodisca vitripennis]